MSLKHYLNNLINVQIINNIYLNFVLNDKLTHIQIMGPIFKNHRVSRISNPAIETHLYFILFFPAVAQNVALPASSLSHSYKWSKLKLLYSLQHLFLIYSKLYIIFRILSIIIFGDLIL